MPAVIAAWWAAGHARETVRRVLKIAPFVAIGVLLAAWLVQRQTVVVTRTRLIAVEAERDDFRRLATNATVPPGKDGTRTLLSTADARAALAGAFRDRDDARHTLDEIDRASKAAKVRSAADDAALGRAQAANARTFQRARAEIERLAAAEPTGDPRADAAAIEIDSKAAWEAWR